MTAPTLDEALALIREYVHANRDYVRSGTDAERESARKRIAAAWKRMEEVAR
jgi:hypothetical protein